jgi:RNA polymerase sigma-70 factor (ECF subfamily)
MSDRVARIRQELNGFLASVEKRAFKTALYAVREEDTALEIVQDSMMKLVQSYSQMPAAEWPLLLQRILQNAIRDHLRRNRVRNLWVSLVGNLRSRLDGEPEDERSDAELLDALAASAGYTAEGPETVVSRRQVLLELESALAKLPARQREAFLLRYWEGLDVRETAEVMGCSEGSVKAHCSRAAHNLAAMLRSLKPDPG